MAKKDRPVVTVDVRCADGSVTIETDARTATLQIHNLMSGHSSPRVKLNALEAGAIADALNAVLDVDDDDDDDD